MSPLNMAQYAFRMLMYEEKTIFLGKYDHSGVGGEGLWDLKR